MTHKPIDTKLLASQCRYILQTYEDVLKYMVREIDSEQQSRINGDTADKIALEYQYRKGIQDGARAVLQKLNSYANTKTDP